MIQNDIMSLEEISKSLQDRKLYIVSKATGLSYPTLSKLSKGQDENYTLDTLKKVSQYLRNV